MLLFRAPTCQVGSHYGGPVLVAQDIAAQQAVMAFTEHDCWEPGDYTLTDTAKVAHTLAPGRPIIIVSDSLSRSSGLAVEAAKAVQGQVFVPRLANGQACDLGELISAKELDALRNQLGQAVSQAQTAESISKAQGGLKVINFEELLNLDLPERGHMLQPVIPEQGLAMLYAPGVSARRGLRCPSHMQSPAGNPCSDVGTLLCRAAFFTWTARCPRVP